MQNSTKMSRQSCNYQGRLQLDNWFVAASK